MQNIQAHLKLIWADKIVLGLILLGFGLMALTWVLAALAAGSVGANHVLGSLGKAVLEEGVLTVFAVWLGLRAIDFAFGGSTYKLFAVHSPDSDKSVLPITANLAAH